jgi:predicted GNAT family acetyltransferase
MARLLSDGVCNACLLDVWTHTAYRRQGIATRMARHLMSQVPGQHIGLQIDAAEAFCATLGFGRQPEFMSVIVGTWLGKEANRQ